MNQRTFLGTSYLDVAKGAIETFMKVCRSRPVHAREWLRRSLALLGVNWASTLSFVYLYPPSFSLRIPLRSIGSVTRRVGAIGICWFHSTNRHERSRCVASRWCVCPLGRNASSSVRFSVEATLFSEFLLRTDVGHGAFHFSRECRYGSKGVNLTY